MIDAARAPVLTCVQANDIAEVDIREKSFVQPCDVQVCAAQVCAAQVCDLQVCDAQVCVTQVCAVQVWNDALVFGAPRIPRNNPPFESSTMSC
jgi:hypothetical protein